MKLREIFFGVFIMLVMLGIISLSIDDSQAAPVPGATNPAVTQSNIKSTICVAGWTRTIRPTASYTNRLKAKQMAQWHLPGQPADYEEDHLISLELGGAPKDPRNLWPEPRNGPANASEKDACENKLHKMVCNGQMLLKDAQYAISHDWQSVCK